MQPRARARVCVEQHDSKWCTKWSAYTHILLQKCVHVWRTPGVTEGGTDQQEGNRARFVFTRHLWGYVMLSLQDSVFFEISIKSLLKSWSGNCEYQEEMCMNTRACTHTEGSRSSECMQTWCAITKLYVSVPLYCTRLFAFAGRHTHTIFLHI